MTLLRNAATLVPLALFAASSGAEGAGSPIEGHWVTQGYDSVVRMAACEDDATQLCGSIVWLWEAVDTDGRPVRDRENSDPARRDDPLLGREIVTGMMRDDVSGKTTKGRIYNPGDGRTYRASLQLTNDSTLHVEGCVMFICQTQIWRRPSAFPRFEDLSN